jgi:hypothetical protein
VGSGAGGTINPTTGVYVAPNFLQTDPVKQFDTIKVTDATSSSTTTTIGVFSPLQLFAEVIEREMALTSRVWLWDQKIKIPQDDLMWVVLTQGNINTMSNVNRSASAGTGPSDGVNAEQSVAVNCDIHIDLKSRGPYARTRALELIRTFVSDYAQRQMAANSFYIAPNPYFMGDFSNQDGAAVPYHYRVITRFQYLEPKTKAVSYFDNFEDTIYTNE